MEINPERKCETGVVWVAWTGGNSGLCRRHPPAYRPSDSQEVWPITKNADWCGEHRTQQEDAAKTHPNGMNSLFYYQKNCEPKVELSADTSAFVAGLSYAGDLLRAAIEQHGASQDDRRNIP